MRKGLRTWTLASFAVWLGACATIIPQPSVRERGGLPPYQAWARVLERFVDARGRVDFAGLAKDRADLDRYVAWVYAVAPSSHPGLFPTRAAELAYHLNAYNALALYNVLESGLPRTLSLWGRYRFFYARKLRVGGAELSLYVYEKNVIRALDEPRLHFALNCMSVGCPRLPRQPFVAATLEASLEREARDFLNEPRNVRVDAAQRVVYLSEIFSFYTEDFLAHSPTLIAYVNRYRAEPIPESYRVAFIPYDWTVNWQP